MGAVNRLVPECAWAWGATYCCGILGSNAPIPFEWMPFSRNLYYESWITENDPCKNPFVAWLVPLQGRGLVSIATGRVNYPAYCHNTVGVEE